MTAAAVSRSVVAGCVAAVWTTFNTVAYASLIFTGPLAAVLPTGITALLLTSAIIGTIVALGSELPGMVAASVSPLVPMYVALVAAFDASMLQHGQVDLPLRGEVALLACGLLTAAAGVALMVVGLLRAGFLVRLLPYPVIAGYYMGLGWIFLTGGLVLGCNLTLNAAGLAGLAGPGGWQFLVCVVWAGVMLGVPRRVKHWAALPAILLLGGIGFHGVRLALGISVAAAQQSKWLLDPVPMARGLVLPGAHAFGWLDGATLWIAAPYVASASLLSILSIMLWTTGTEVDSRRTLNLDRELVLAGAANLLGGLAGGMACGQGYSTTTILRRQGAMTRTAALMPGLVALAVAAAGPAILGLVPRFIVATLLLSTGFDFLVLRPMKDLRTLLRHEVAIVVAVAATVIMAGMVAGVAAGLGLALILFAIGYARSPVIRVGLTRDACRSTVVRPEQAEALLAQQGASILLCRLQGRIFFLNAREIPTVMPGYAAAGLRHLILDFRDVSGMDNSVHAAFERLRQIAAERDFRVLFCGMRPDIERQFRLRGLLQPGHGPNVQRFDTADAALRDAEEHVLRDSAFGETEASWSLAEQLGRARGGDMAPFAARLSDFMDTVRFARGETLIRQGDPADALYLLVDGTVATEVSSTEGRRPIRLSTAAGAGTVIGEVGMLCQGVRTASVVAETACEALVLTAEALDRMEASDPPLATLLHRFLLREIASKLSDSTRLVRMQAQ